MKTLLIGISSPIGQSFLKASSNRGLDVIAISDPYSDQGSIYTQLGKTIECDLSDEQKLQELLFQEWPDVLINCTEEILDEEKMARSNTHLPKFLSQLTHHLGTRFIHISSNAIFDGTKSDFYRSTDVPNPQTFYGQTKLLGEKEILKSSSSNPLILRIPEILSSDSKSVQKSFNQKILQSAQSKQVIELTNTKQFQPTSSTNIADVILELCERNDLHGIFHWAGSETINEYELAKLILNRANVVNPGDLIKLNSDSTISNFCMELHPLKNKLKTQALNLKEIFEELDYREPLNFN
jgi:dTDP-4-dehydrorhamnose reductase